MLTPFAIAKNINKKYINTTILKQISKFIVVGVINTGIDFAVLNLLMFLTGTYSGKWLILFNSISFTTAVINSYFMNKRWTFQAQTAEKNSGKKFMQFIIVSIIGISINNAVVYAITTLFTLLFGLSSQLWTNVAKIFATAVSMIWNFIGYKFFVFKTKSPTTTP